MENITNWLDRISNEQIVNVLCVQQQVIKRVLLVYSITIMTYVLIDSSFFFLAECSSVT